MFKPLCYSALAGVAQWVGASSHKPEGHRFYAWSGHKPKLPILSPLRALTRGNPSTFLYLPTLLTLKAMKKCPWVRGKK